MKKSYILILALALCVIDSTPAMHQALQTGARSIRSVVPRSRLPELGRRFASKKTKPKLTPEVSTQTQGVWSRYRRPLITSALVGGTGIGLYKKFLDHYDLVSGSALGPKSKYEYLEKLAKQKILGQKKTYEDYLLEQDIAYQILLNEEYKQLKRQFSGLERGEWQAKMAAEILSFDDPKFEKDRIGLVRKALLNKLKNDVSYYDQLMFNATQYTPDSNFLEAFFNNPTDKGAQTLITWIEEGDLDLWALIDDFDPEKKVFNIKGTPFNQFLDFAKKQDHKIFDRPGSKTGTSFTQKITNDIEKLENQIKMAKEQNDLRTIEYLKKALGGHQELVESINQQQEASWAKWIFGY